MSMMEDLTLILKQEQEIEIAIRLFEYFEFRNRNEIANIEALHQPERDKHQLDELKNAGKAYRLANIALREKIHSLRYKATWYKDVDEKENSQGLKVKYDVRKISTGELVNDCFVLRPDVDTAAIPAMRAYAASTENKQLAEDIYKWVGKPICRIQGKPYFTITNIDEFTGEKTETIFYAGKDSKRICKSCGLKLEE